MKSATQKSFTQSGGGHSFVLIDTAVPIDIYRDEDDQVWINFADAYHVVGMGAFEERDGMQIFYSVAKHERAECADVSLIRDVAMYKLILRHPLLSQRQMLETALEQGVLAMYRSEQEDKRRARPWYGRFRRKPKIENSRRGFVYLIQSISLHYKIGRTRDINDRLRVFGVKLPFEIELVHLIECEDMFEMERELHHRFADRRVNGEWFLLTAADIEAIKAIKGVKS